MAIAGISSGTGSLNLGLSASIQATGFQQLNPALQAADPASSALALVAAGSPGGLGGNSSVNNLSALATALLIGALSSEDEDKKKGNSLAGAALALLAYNSIAGLGQGAGAGGLPTDVLTATAASAVSFAATA